MHAMRIAVDPAGNPWVVTCDHQFFRHANGRWLPLPGRGVDISIGANGAVWALGEAESASARNHPVLRWNGVDWDRVRGTAVRFAVAPTGVPWIINDAHQLFRLVNGTQWQELPGTLKEIAIGPQGSVWGLGMPEGQASGSFPIMRLDGLNWEKFPGAGTRIAVDARGGPWVVNERDELYRLDDGFSWHGIPGMVTEIAIGADGTAWAIGRTRDNEPPPVVRWDGEKWNRAPVISADSPATESALPQLPASMPGTLPVAFRSNGSDWRQTSSRVREISVEADGTIALRLEDGQCVPLKEGSEVFIPDERTQGLKIQLNVRKAHDSVKNNDPEQGGPTP